MAKRFVPGDYPTITDAIAAASDGDRILIAPGTYGEEIVIDRVVHLVAETDDIEANPVVFSPSQRWIGQVRVEMKPTQATEIVIEGVYFDYTHGGSNDRCAAWYNGSGTNDLVTLHFNRCYFALGGSHFIIGEARDGQTIRFTHCDCEPGYSSYHFQNFDDAVLEAEKTVIYYSEWRARSSSVDPNAAAINDVVESPTSGYGWLSGPFLKKDEYRVAGLVTVEGSPVSTTVRFYSESTGALLGEATSAADGTYTWITYNPEAVYAVATPPSGERPLAHGPVTPELA